MTASRKHHSNGVVRRTETNRNETTRTEMKPSVRMWRELRITNEVQLLRRRDLRLPIYLRFRSYRLRERRRHLFMRKRSRETRKLRVRNFVPSPKKLAREFVSTSQRKEKIKEQLQRRVELDVNSPIHVARRKRFAAYEAERIAKEKRRIVPFDDSVMSPLDDYRETIDRYNRRLEKARLTASRTDASIPEISSSSSEYMAANAKYRAKFLARQSLATANQSVESETAPSYKVPASYKVKDPEIDRIRQVARHGNPFAAHQQKPKETYRQYALRLKTDFSIKNASIGIPLSKKPCIPSRVRHVKYEVGKKSITSRINVMIGKISSVTRKRCYVVIPSMAERVAVASTSMRFSIQDLGIVPGEHQSRYERAVRRSELETWELVVVPWVILAQQHTYGCLLVPHPATVTGDSEPPVPEYDDGSPCSRLPCIQISSSMPEYEDDDNYVSSRLREDFSNVLQSFNSLADKMRDLDDKWTSLNDATLCVVCGKTAKVHYEFSNKPYASVASIIAAETEPEYESPYAILAGGL